MKRDLVTDTDEIKRMFWKLNSRQDIAKLLEISEQTLIYYLYRRNPEENYKTFSLSKKKGGIRKISAPQQGLKIIQFKLSEILRLVYNPRLSVHGFTRNKDIISNASSHTKKKFVLNVDIKDFFPSINFGRVRGIFLSKPYDFCDEVATTLAQIACYEGSLPQGSPCSPIISNMVCSRMDGELICFSKDNFFTYSRYADDISISSSKRELSNLLIKKGLDKAKVSDELKEIIESNGFKINKKKVRIQSKHSHQGVTGLTVNVKVNISRSFVREIRAMLHAWEIYGYKDAEKVFLSKYYKKQHNPKLGKPSFKKVLLGKINFLQNVRGKNDKLFIKMINIFNKLNGDPRRLPIDYFERVRDSLWVIQYEDDSDLDDQVIVNGTGFMTKYGLITNYHVVENTPGELKIFRLGDEGKKYSAVIKAYDKRQDLAILEAKTDRDFQTIQLSRDKIVFNHGKKITLCGFPNYESGASVSILEKTVTGSRVRHAIKRIQIDSGIVYGMSGGPALDIKTNKVVGVIVRGGRNNTESYNVVNEIIPISFLNDLIHELIETL